MGYRYFICDVFTSTRFGGNQLAVFLDGRGLPPVEVVSMAGVRGALHERGPVP